MTKYIVEVRRPDGVWAQYGEEKHDSKLAAEIAAMQARDMHGLLVSQTRTTAVEVP